MGRRPAAAPPEVRHVQRDGFRLGRQPRAADPGGEGVEVPPVGGVGALAGGGAAGLGGRAGVGTQLLDRRGGVGREQRQRHFFFVERFGRDCHVIRGFDMGPIRCAQLRRAQPSRAAGGGQAIPDARSVTQVRQFRNADPAGATLRQVSSFKVERQRFGAQPGGAASRWRSQQATKPAQSQAWARLRSQRMVGAKSWSVERGRRALGRPMEAFAKTYLVHLVAARNPVSWRGREIKARDQ
jgi:hypothetical protein